MKLTTRAITQLNLYLNGDDQAFDHFADTTVTDFDKGFFKTPIRCKGDPVLAEEVRKLLIKLDIPDAQQAKYLKSTSTVHGFLKLLSERTKEKNPAAHQRLEQFIQKINNFQLVNTLEFFAKNLREGGGKEALQKYMKSYDKKMAKVNADFFTTTISSDPAVQNAAKQIFDALGIPERQRGRYTGTTLTVHDFLQELHEQTKQTSGNKEKLAELKVFVEAIETKSKISKQKALLYGLGALLPIVASMPYGGFTVMQQIVTAALFTPVVSIAAVAGVGLYRLYNTTFDKNLPLLDKIRENIFILASTALKITGYGLVIAAAATAAPVAAVLTAAAEGIGVIQEGFKLLQMKLKGKCRPPRDGTEPLNIKQEDARFDAEYSAKKKTLWVSLGTAIALTGLAVAACLFPIAGAAIVAGMAAIFTAQFAAEKYIAKSTKKALDAKFTALEKADEEKENELQAAHQLTNNAELTESLGVRPTSTLVIRAAVEEAQELADDDLAFITPDTESSGYRTESVTPDVEAHQIEIRERLSHIKRGADEPDEGEIEGEKSSPGSHHG